MLTVEQIAARLDDPFHLLTGGSRTALPRHQTLRACIDWSYNLLSPEERALLRRLSVFRGGWTLEAAEEVCGDSVARVSIPGSSIGEGMDGQPNRQVSKPDLHDTVARVSIPGSSPDERKDRQVWKPDLQKGDVLDLLTKLVDRSLVVVGQGSGQAMRCRMLDTIRQYAREKLVEAGEEADARCRHLAFFRECPFKQRASCVGPNRSSGEDGWGMNSTTSAPHWNGL